MFGGVNETEIRSTVAEKRSIFFSNKPVILFETGLFRLKFWLILYFDAD